MSVVWHRISSCCEYSRAEQDIAVDYSVKLPSTYTSQSGIGVPDGRHRDEMSKHRQL